MNVNRVIFKRPFSLLLFTIALAACEQNAETTAQHEADAGNGAPTKHTIAINKAVLSELPFDDVRDFEEAQRGLIVASENLIVKHPTTGEDLWNIPSYDFIKGDAPDSVNPSLWRQAKLNGTPGLYKVKEGIWQLRNFDLATISIIQGKTGWILIDPGTTTATGQVAMEFLRKHLLGDKPISTIVFTHSHVDHFGGALGFVQQQQIDSGNVKIVAPEGFLEEASSENIMLGRAMARRAGYQYGQALKPSVYGDIDLGLGKSVPFGPTSLVLPSLVIRETGEEHVLDGVRFVFQIASGTEAPAEMTFFLPEHNAFCGAEVISRTMHNVYTLRGAKVRDALLWSQVIDSILQNYGNVDVIFNSHHWPVWGTQRISRYLETQRDTYKFIHDQTVRMIQNGLTPNEIANQIELPEELNAQFSSRGYYGTLQHNAKAVYQYYMGWYDGNPANLHPLPTVESAPKYMQLMGGIDSVVEKAQTYYDNGEYQWVAELLNHAVFSNPDHDGAKALLANTYDQMGYQAESGPWRSEYLTAAHELRHGITVPEISTIDSVGILSQTPIPTFLQTIAVGIDAEKAAGKDIVVDLVLSDINEAYVLVLRNSVLNFYTRSQVNGSDSSTNLNKYESSVTLTLSKVMLLKILSGEGSLKEILLGDDLSVEGSMLDLFSFFSSLGGAAGNFPIVTP
jgi:alkyl sulfatase BDS1-like metallo-beta-lactamase superfamily hydrolase